MVLGEMNTFGSMPMNEEDAKKVFLEVINENLDANDKMGIRLSLYFSYDKEKRDSKIDILDEIKEQKDELELFEFEMKNIEFLENTIKELGKIHSFKYFKPEKYDISKELLKELLKDLEEYTRYNEYDMEQYKHDKETIKDELKDLEERNKKFLKEKKKKTENVQQQNQKKSMPDMITDIGFGQ
jgi:ribosomal protein S18